MQPAPASPPWEQTIAVDLATGLPTLPLGAIGADRETQVRERIDAKWVSHLADQYRAGVQLAPVVVFWDGIAYWLADGHHRLEAAKLVGLERLSVDARSGSKSDAVFFGIEANAHNRLYFTRADKRRAVETFLRDERRRVWPNNRIAKACGVDPHTVKRRKDDLGISQVAVVEVTKSDGTSYPLRTCKIGRGGDLGELRRSLHFVLPGVSKRDLVPALAHLHIREGRVLAYNGAQAFSAPFPVEVECSPKATQLRSFLDACKEVPALTMDPSGKLVATASGLVQRIDCCPDPSPEVRPEGEEDYIPGPGLLAAFRQLAPFISKDASQPWTRGVMFAGDFAYAYDGESCILRLDWHGPALGVNVPTEAVEAVIHQNEEPERIQVGEASLTFHHPGGRWMRTQLLPLGDWPQLRDQPDAPAAPTPIPAGLFDALRALGASVDAERRVFLLGDRVATSANASEGAAVSLPDLPALRCVYDLDKLLRLDGVATHMDWAASVFEGPGVRGSLLPLNGDAPTSFQRKRRYPRRPTPPTPAVMKPDTQQQVSDALRAVRLSPDGRELVVSVEQLRPLLERLHHLGLLAVPRDTWAAFLRDLPTLLAALGEQA